MTISMGKANVDKVLSAAKGIDLSKFHNQNTADPENPCDCHPFLIA
jgi:hypothetical protein